MKNFSNSRINYFFRKTINECKNYPSTATHNELELGDSQKLGPEFLLYYTPSRPETMDLRAERRIIKATRIPCCRRMFLQLKAQLNHLLLIGDNMQILCNYYRCPFCELVVNELGFPFRSLYTNVLPCTSGCGVFLRVN